MKVRTLRAHSNEHAPVYEKQNGRVYDLPDAEAKRLIKRGLVEAHDADKRGSSGVSEAGQSARGPGASNVERNGKSGPSAGDKDSIGADGGPSSGSSA